MPTEALDVVIIGAGLSGIAAAHHLQQRCPGSKFAILESRAALGGTWDLFRFPGVRSDSDLYSLGYSFKPWTGATAIAGGPAILGYLQEAAREAGIEEKIRYRQRLVAAAWDSARALWTLQVERSDGLPALTLECAFLFMCTGYYAYDTAHRPSFEGEAEFSGRIVHPQFWPPDLDYRGKRVIVIGSGATAVTLLPAMAADCAHITMLQRSPTYVVARPGTDRFASTLRACLPAPWAHCLARWKFILRDQLFYQAATWLPTLTRTLLLARLRRQLGSAEQVARHFTPRYAPWDQRICLVPDGDLFACLKSGRASVETDAIARFTAGGIRLQSGRELAADIIVTATGLEMELMRGVRLSVDGSTISLADTFAYKGCMYSGIPNLVSAFGYSNASWTLKAELICEYACRLLQHLQATRSDYCVARTSAVTATGAGPMNLSSGYVVRALARLPRQGAQAPWKTLHNYLADIRLLRHAPLEDGVLQFSRRGPPATGSG